MDPIKKQSVYLKTLFFLFFVALGAGSPYFGIFYKHVIVNADGTPAIGLIGLIFFVMPLVSLIANIPAGILADKFHSGKHLITFLCFGVALFAFLIGLTGGDFARDWGLGGKFIFIFSMLFFLNCCLLPLMPMVDAETLLFLNQALPAGIVRGLPVMGYVRMEHCNGPDGGSPFLFPQRFSDLLWDGTDIYPAGSGILVRHRDQTGGGSHSNPLESSQERHLVPGVPGLYFSQRGGDQCRRKLYQLLFR